MGQEGMGDLSAFPFVTVMSGLQQTALVRVPTRVNTPTGVLLENLLLSVYRCLPLSRLPSSSPRPLPCLQGTQQT